MDVNSVLGIAEKYPDLCAAGVGLLLSWGATQSIKRLLPSSMSDDNYRRAVQGIGFVTGWIFAHGAWIIFDPTSSHFEKLYMSAGVGFASPALYSAVISYLAGKYQWAKALSGRPSEDPPK